MADVNWPRAIRLAVYLGFLIGVLIGMLRPRKHRPVYDSFTRSVTNGWGTSPTGEPWQGFDNPLAHWSLSEAQERRRDLAGFIMHEYTIDKGDDGYIRLLRDGVVISMQYVGQMSDAPTPDVGQASDTEDGLTDPWATENGLRHIHVFHGDLAGHSYHIDHEHAWQGEHPTDAHEAHPELFNAPLVDPQSLPGLPGRSSVEPRTNPERSRLN